MATNIGKIEVMNDVAKEVMSGVTYKLSGVSNYNSNLLASIQSGTTSFTLMNNSNNKSGTYTLDTRNAESSYSMTWTSGTTNSTRLPYTIGITLPKMSLSGTALTLSYDLGYTPWASSKVSTDITGRLSLYSMYVENGILIVVFSVYISAIPGCTLTSGSISSIVRTTTERFDGVSITPATVGSNIGEMYDSKLFTVNITT